MLVVAEVVGRVDPHTGEQIPHPFAEGVGATREQLLELPGGRRALWGWERGDDSTYAAGRESFMRASDVEETQEFASSGNRWAQELVSAGFPEEDVRTFLSSDQAVPAGFRLLG